MRHRHRDLVSEELRHRFCPTKLMNELDNMDDSMFCHTAEPDVRSIGMQDG
jgi:hypothetical protein